MRVYFICSILLFVCWLMPCILFAQEDERFAEMAKNYQQVIDANDIAGFEEALSAAHAQTEKLMNTLPKNDTRGMRIREIKEVFAYACDFLRKRSAERTVVHGVLERLYPGFDLDSPDLELLPQEMLVELIDDYLEVYNVVRMNLSGCSYVLFNVKSEKIRNAYVLPFLRRTFEQEGFGKKVAEICENVRWCSKTPETVKEVEALVEQYRPLQAGAAAPEFVLENRKGESVKLSGFKGKHVFIGVFSVGMDENEAISRFMDLPDEYNNTDRFVYLCVCLGKADAREAWRKQVDEKAGKVDFLFCDVERCSFVRDYCISRLPRYVFVNKDGSVRNAWYIAPGMPEFSYQFGDKKTLNLLDMLK